MLVEGGLISYMKNIHLTYFKIRNAVRYCRKNYNLKREVWAFILPLTIMGSIGMDAYIQKAQEPVFYQVAHAEEVKPKTVLIDVHIEWTKERIIKEIETKATKYGVSAEVMKTVIYCESRYNKDALGDGGKSRGLSQIHSYYHPDVLDSEAYDPAFAIDFLASHLAEGRGYLWSCYNQNY